MTNQAEPSALNGAIEALRIKLAGWKEELTANVLKQGFSDLRHFRMEVMMLKVQIADILLKQSGAATDIPKKELVEFTEWEMSVCDDYSCVKRERKEPKPGFVYLAINQRNHLYKIGWSEVPGFREKTLQSEEPEIRFLSVHEGTTTIEKELHERFKDHRVRGEWFNLDDSQVRDVVRSIGGAK